MPFNAAALTDSVGHIVKRLMIRVPQSHVRMEANVSRVIPGTLISAPVYTDGRAVTAKIHLTYASRTLVTMVEAVALARVGTNTCAYAKTDGVDQHARNHRPTLAM